MLLSAKESVLQRQRTGEHDDRPAAGPSAAQCTGRTAADVTVLVEDGPGGEAIWRGGRPGGG